MEFLHKQYGIGYVSHSQLGLPRDRLTQTPRNVQSLHLKFTATPRLRIAALRTRAKDWERFNWSPPRNRGINYVPHLRQGAPSQWNEVGAPAPPPRPDHQDALLSERPEQGNKVCGMVSSWWSFDLATLPVFYINILNKREKHLLSCLKFTLASKVCHLNWLGASPAEMINLPSFFIP